LITLLFKQISEEGLNAMLNAEKKTSNYNEQLCKYYEQFKVYRDKVLVLSNDSLEKTIAVALALCLVCAVLVSLATVALRPLQSYNKALDMKKNILDVAGLLQDNTDIDQAFKERIESKIVDLKTGEYIDSINADEYDQRKAAKDPAQNELIPVDKDIASIRMKAKYTKIYLVKKGDQLQSIILPVNGYGLWSTMYGFLALEPDAQTVQSINLYDQAETPGLGGEVVNPIWRALWKGKKVYSDKGDVALTLVKGGVDESRADAVYKVDGLAGATLTSRGVSNLVQYWMGAEGFATYLNKIRTKG
jgi:Na+-transporting NADH:ubiquinone oxidoreductase subunit C